ncbi:hypothetical protein ACH436_00500 [Isoptericola sp. NPDC019693]|uniref:hypothetical protein n=1 Tax=Isoptericola sp. NPDC019693 TaxID=3364009 RepID=UPI00379EA26B
MSFSFELALGREEEIRHQVWTPERLGACEQRFQQATRGSVARGIRDLVAAAGRRVARLRHHAHVRPGVPHSGAPSAR